MARRRPSTCARFVTLQAQYSLVVRDLEREHVPLCREYGLGILPWSPLAGGFLTGKFERGKPPPAGRAARQVEGALRAATTPSATGGSSTPCAPSRPRSSATPAAVALAWLLAKPQVTSVIFGARSLEQLDDNLKAADLALSADQVARSTRPRVRPRLSVRVHAGRPGRW